MQRHKQFLLDTCVAQISDSTQRILIEWLTYSFDLFCWCQKPVFIFYPDTFRLKSKIYNFVHKLSNIFFILELCVMYWVYTILHCIWWRNAFLSKVEIWLITLFVSLRPDQFHLVLILITRIVFVLENAHVSQNCSSSLFSIQDGIVTLLNLTSIK